MKKDFETQQGSFKVIFSYNYKKYRFLKAERYSTDIPCPTHSGWKTIGSPFPRSIELETFADPAARLDQIVNTSQCELD